MKFQLDGNTSVSDLLSEYPNTIKQLVELCGRRAPEQMALVENGGSWSYPELHAVVRNTAAAFRDRGVRAGDRVMLVGENCRAFIAVFLATVMLDAWPVLVNARLSAREVDLVRDHCGPRRVIYTTKVSAHALEHATRHSAVVEELGGLGSIGIGPLNEQVTPEPTEDEDWKRVAALIYTSGTTGTPKGVMLTHRNLLFIAKVSAQIRSLTAQDRLYGALPMTHAVGLSVVLLGSLLSGASVYLAPHFDPITARAVFEKERLTVVLGVPSMFTQFLQYAKLRGMTSLRLPELRIISSSGAPLDLPTKHAVEAFFGLPLHNGYGITECSPTIAQPRVDAPRNDTSVGPLLPGVEAKFMGTNGEELPIGEVGELWVRGPNIMKGYYRDCAATAAAVDAEGWFNSRDLAKLENGNLFVVGRTKDLIVRSGFNVYPVEVEAVLNSHPTVARSAVLGRSIAGDEKVLAFVELLPGSSASTADLADFAAQRLAPYKRPNEIILSAKLPVTPTGKIAKAELMKLLDDLALQPAATLQKH